MCFYAKWNSALKNHKSDRKFIESFLTTSEQSTLPLMQGSEEELLSVCQVLEQVSLGDMLGTITSLSQLPELEKADVPCFSNLERGISRVNDILEFAVDGLTYSELGYKLMASETDNARKKYGENQAKLAEICSLVTITRKSHTYVVRPTALGTYLTQYSFDDEKNILCKLMLRNPCLQHLIYRAADGYVLYSDVVKILAVSTQLRRRSNVRALMKYILTDTDYEIILANIDWKIQEK